METHERTRTASTLFGKEGEYWTIGYEGRLFRIRDIKGLGYLAQLLRNPSHEFHALDLASNDASADAKGPQALSKLSAQQLSEEPNLSKGSLGDAGELLDAEAKASYKHRLGELSEELSEAKELGKVEQAEKIEDEIDALRAQLSQAVGMGGRDRRAGSAAERARVSVTNAIKFALAKIAENDRDLAKLLAKTIRTGTFCSYAPDFRLPIAWQFEELVPAEEFAQKQESSVEPVQPPAQFRYRTVFVGRESELAEFAHLLDEVAKGCGTIVMIGGSPGVGKSRLAAEVALEAHRKGFQILIGHCYDRKESVPYLPFVEALEMALAQAPSPDAFRALLGEDAAELARLMPELKRMFPDVPPPMELPPESARRRLFNAMCGLFSRTARQHPLILVLEDVHWADESTLSLLSHLTQRVSAMPVTVLATYRDLQQEITPALAALLEELVRGRLARMVRLNPLSSESVGWQLEGLSGQEPPEDLVSEIYRETEGNPFFVEEVFKHLEEEQRLFDANGRFRVDIKINELEVPRNVRLVIGRRLERLPDETRRALSAAAVIGYGFSFALLALVTQIDSDALLDAVDEAQAVGLIVPAPGKGEARFAFTHELIRQTLLTGLSAPRRQRMCLAIADAIERLYQGRVDEHAADIAHHLIQAGDAADAVKALHYLEMAAKQAGERAAYEQAVMLANSALEVLKRVPESPERDAQELRLTEGLVALLRATRQWTAPELTRATARAEVLVGKSGDPARLVANLKNRWTTVVMSGDYATSREFADRILELAQREGSAVSLVLAHNAQQVTRYRIGDLAGAEEHFATASAFFDAPGFKDRGYAVGMRGYASWNAWTIGHADLACERSRRMTAIARDINRPFELAFALFMDASLKCKLRAPEQAEVVAAESVAISDKHGVEEFASVARVILGWARVHLGRPGENITLVRQGLKKNAESGQRVTFEHICLSDALRLSGATDEALDMIEEALLMVPQELVDRPEAFRLRGELRVTTGRADLGEADYREAIALARKIGAKAWELRATMSLARLLAKQSKREEARKMLAEIYSWFTEGFDTADLEDAKALLGELS